MSGTIIKDGTGSGKAVRVTDNNYLATTAIEVTELTHISSVEGGAHNYHFSRVLTTNGDENIAFIKYTGDDQLQIDSVRFSREDVNLDSNAQSLFTIYKNIEYTSGGSLVTDFNMNLGSTEVASTVAYSGSTSLVIDTANQFKLEDVVVKDFVDLEYKGSLILKKGDALYIKAKSKNIGDRMHVSLFTYEVKEII